MSIAIGHTYVIGGRKQICTDVQFPLFNLSIASVRTSIFAEISSLGFQIGRG